jgi:hypothetical protein
MTKHEHERSELPSTSSRQARLHALLFSRAGFETSLVEPCSRGWPKVPQLQGE